jgi:hypothetical protein
MPRRTKATTSPTRRKQPHAHFLARVQHDLLGETEAQIVLEELAIGPDIDREAVEMVEPANIRAAGGIALGLVFQRGTQDLRRLIPLGFMVKFDHMPIGVCEAIRWPVTIFVLDSANSCSRTLDRLDPLL